MAKKDFCFTYYDGDAARDMAHMNRLERGAYTDIMISQRKFGNLTIEQIKKILGRDFDDCWGAIELILSRDTDGKYFIEWVHQSLEKMAKHSKKQSENVRNRYQKDTKHIPKNDLEIPLGNGYGDGNENVLDGGLGEDTHHLSESGFFLTDLPKDLQLSPTEIQQTIEYCSISLGADLDGPQVIKFWEGFKIQNFSKREWKNSRAHLISHFRDSLKYQPQIKNGQHGHAKNLKNYAHQPVITGTATGAGKI